MNSEGPTCCVLEPTRVDEASDMLRARHHREERNGVEILTGYIVGKYIPVAGLFAAGFSFGGVVQPGLARMLAESFAMLVGAVLFIRFVLPPMARLMYNEERQRKRTPERRRKEWRLLGWVFAGIAVAIGIAGVAWGAVPFLIACVPWLSGITGALLWAGSRWQSGDEQRCARCGYPRGTPEPDQCPECGLDRRRRWGTTLGHRGANRRMLIASACSFGVLAVVVAVLVVIFPFH